MLRPGMRIGRKYELTRKVGSGAMGEVWAAQHLSLEEEVAIKIVMRDVAHEDGSSNESRFLLEAQVASQLSRKTRHIVSVTDHGEDGPYAYLVMELLRGESLDVRLARTGPMPIEKVIPIIQQVARALTVAHGEGIVHRDLKPSNVFVTADEDNRPLVKILDFGIAKLRASLRKVAIAVPGTLEDAKHKTLSGFLLGTPAYMSPEQAKGLSIDARADVWALAVITFHLLSAQFPFDADTPEQLIARLIRVQPFPITKFLPDAPRPIAELFERAFARVMDQRFQTATDFADELEDVIPRMSHAPLLPQISLPPPSPDDVPIHRTAPRKIALAALAGVALLGGAALFKTFTDTPPPVVAITHAASAKPLDDSIPPPPQNELPPPETKLVAKAVVATPPPPTTDDAEPTAPPAAEPPPPAPVIAPPPTPAAAARPRKVDKSEVF